MKNDMSAQSNLFLSLLAVLFIGLKLSGHIDWSWWWVLAPLWLPVVVVLALFAVVSVTLVVINAVSRRR